MANYEPRSDLNIIRGRAGSHFYAVQGESRVVDRVSMSGEQRGNANCDPGPSGCALKSALAMLSCLKIAPLFSAHGALLSPILDCNTSVNNFETASSNQRHPRAVDIATGREKIDNGCIE
jgi:hypothetical protein